jgi:AcrR family transcriptional regulator
MTDFISHNVRFDMPRTAAANQQIRDAQRARIVEAAWTVFAQKGRATTMADVAAAAEVSYGLAYRYFANKEALYQALVEESLHVSAAAMERFVEQSGTPRERIIALISGLVNTRRTRPELAQLLAHVLGDAATPTVLREQAGQIGRVVQDLLRQLIVEGQARGEVRAADPDQLVTAVLAILDGLSRLAAGNPDRFHQHFPDAHIVLGLLLPAVPTREE